MTQPGLRERLSYAFDNWMAKGTLALMALLGGATVLLVLLFGGLVFAFGAFPDGDSANDNALDIFWGNLMRAMDPGAMGGDTGWGFRVLMLALTLGGLILVASLIGIVSGAFDAKVEDLRKGRSRVLESDHTLILGWSSKVFPIVRELCIANESRGRSAVVILADRDKVSMEDDLRAQLGNTGNTRVIVRSGDPMNLAELEVASPHSARSIIVLAPEGDDDPDSVVIKATLAVTNNPNRKAGKYHLVGELRDPANLEAARLVGKDEAHWVLADELFSRIMVQTCRQSGLSVVYSELLDFDGAEVYFSEQPTLVGTSFFEAQLSFADSMAMGIMRGDTALLNPPSDTVLTEGDRLILIAEDDSTIKLGAVGVVDAQVVSEEPLTQPAAETTLVLGYNDSLPGMIAELAEYSAAGSRATVVADCADPGLPQYDTLEVKFIAGDPTSRGTLNRLDVTSYDHVLVVASSSLPTQRADAKTLITLLHLRDLSVESGVDLNVVSEMLDDRNRELAEVTQADDFIVSDRLISLMLSQVSENEQLTDVFEQLFSSAGAEIYLRPCAEYVQPGVPVTFYSVLEGARRRGETAIGHRIAEHAHTADRGYGVDVNPHKGESRVYAPGDRIIVLAER